MFIARVEEAAECGLNTEHVEVVAGGLVDPGSLRRGTVWRRAAFALMRKAARSLKVVLRARRSTKSGIRVAEICLGLSARFRRGGRDGQVEGIEEHGIEDAEDDDVGADAEGEGEDRGNGKAGRMAQLAERVAEVAREAFENECGVGGGDAFAGRGGVAEAEDGFAAGFFRRHAAGHILVGAQIDVGLQFGVDVAVERDAAEEIREATEAWPWFPPDGDYSLRRASMGSTREARRAGIQLEARAIAAIAMEMPMKTVGSSGRTPRRRLATPRARKKASTRPLRKADGGKA